MAFIPAYRKLYDTGGLEQRYKQAEELLNSCTICPHECRVDRTANKRGICKSGLLPIVSSYTLHHGEEPVLSGKRGAGNIFFGNCNLSCIFCQNYEISQNCNEEEAHAVTPERLADIMIELQQKGAHNIGLVSPTHYAVPILKSIFIAAGKGLNLPIIYNSNGYDSVETLKLFDGVIDIYLPDCKYGNDMNGKKFSNAEEYFTHSKEAIKEMYRQVGGKLIYENNTCVRGLIIRHLVLPNGLSESENVFKFIAGELSSNVYISLMSQYYPVNKASNEILLNRKLKEIEYCRAVELLGKYNLNNGWIQEIESSDYYKPEFRNKRNDPFSS